MATPDARLRRRSLRRVRFGDALLTTLLTGLLLTAAPARASAQSVDFSAYALSLGTYVGESAVAMSGLSAFQRLRGMAIAHGSGWSVDVAYEHTLTLREAGASGAQLFTASGATTNGDWLDLSGTIEERETVLWRHRVDRAALDLDIGSAAELIIGRQPVSWATTLLFTPADPFSPFDPSDPFRVYRQGIDAARLRVYPDPVSEVDVVIRRADFGFQRTTTATVRGATSVGGWDVSAWGGAVHGEAAGSMAVSGSLGPWAVRAEGTVRDRNQGGAAFRGTVGVDRRFAVTGRDLYVVVEYLHDGFGLDRLNDLVLLAETDAFRRGELQVLGRDEAAFQASLQLHPLVGLSGLALVNLRDGSALFAPSVAWSASTSGTVGIGGYVALGRSVDAVGIPRSEFGAVPTVFYVSASWFF